jgi:hypothetical protein
MRIDRTGDALTQGYPLLDLDLDHVPAASLLVLMNFSDSALMCAPGRPGARHDIGERRSLVTLVHAFGIISRDREVSTPSWNSAVLNSNGCGRVFFQLVDDVADGPARYRR